MRARSQCDPHAREHAAHHVATARKDHMLFSFAWEVTLRASCIHEMTQRLSTASSQIRNLRPVSRKVFVVPTRDRRSFADRTFSGTAQLSLLDQAPMLLSTGQSGVLLGGDRHSANTWERNLRLRGLHRTPPWYPRSRNGAEAPTSRQATASSRAPRNRQPTLHQSAMHSLSTLPFTPNTGLLSDS